MSEMLLLNWFPLQLWSLCGLSATLVICTLMLHLGPSCLSPTALGSTAAAMTTWPRSWQDSTCLSLPMTMVSSLNLYLIYSSSGLCWNKRHYTYLAVREEPIKYLQPDINEKGIICCFVKSCTLFALSFPQPCPWHYCWCCFDLTLRDDFSFTCLLGVHCGIGTRSCFCWIHSQYPMWWEAEMSA